MSKSDEIAARQARYNRVERVVDAAGRTIGVKMLKPSQRIRVEEMAPNLTGSEPVTTAPDEEGRVRTFDMPKIARLIFAASVVEVDDAVFSFPRDRGELDSVVDMLDDEGMAAVAEGIAKLSGIEPDKADKSVADMAKNSSGTPSQDKPNGSSTTGSRSTQPTP